MEEQERWPLGRYRSDPRSGIESGATAYGYTLTVYPGVTLDCMGVILWQAWCFWLASWLLTCSLPRLAS